MGIPVNPKWPLTCWQAAFNQDPNDNTVTPVWADLTDRVTSWDAKWGAQYELGQIETGTASLGLIDDDEYLNPANSASPWYTAGAPLVRQSGTGDTGASPSSSVAAYGALPPREGSLLVAVTSTNLTAVTPLANGGGPAWTLVKTVSSAVQTVNVWAKLATGREPGWVEVDVDSGALATFACTWLEITGVVGDILSAIDVTASASRVASSSASQATGTTGATTQASEVVVFVAAPHGYAGASVPASPTYTSSGVARVAAGTNSGTAAVNNALFMGSKTVAATGTQTSTVSWTGVSPDAAGVVVTIRNALTLVPYRPVRCWAMWPLTGNIVNSGNGAWFPGLTDSSTFEGGTVGAWVAANGGTLANSSAHAQNGTKSLLLTWASQVTPFSYAHTVIPPLRTGVTYTASAYVWVATGPAVFLRIDGATSANSSTTGAWQRLTVTFTKTDNSTDLTNALYVVASATTTAGQQVFIDAVQVEVGASASAFTTSGPTVYPIFTGYIERYPLRWSSAGYFGTIDGMTCVDALTFLPRDTLDGVLNEELAQDLPHTTYKLAEDAWPAQATQESLSRFPSQVIEMGVGGASPTFGISDSPDPDGGTCVQITPVDGSNFRFLYVPTDSIAYDFSYPYGSGMECWFKTTRSTGVQTVVSANGSSGAAWDLGVTGVNVFARVTNNPVTPTYFYTMVSVGVNFADGDWHHLIATEVQDGAGGTNAALYADGKLVDTAARATNPFVIDSFNIGASWAPTPQAPFYGFVSHVSAYGQALSATRAASHYAVTAGAFGGDTAGARIRRLLAWANWQGPTSIPDGASNVDSAVGMSGKSLADAIGACTRTENGYLFVGGDGVLTMVTRDSYYLQTTPVLTFGESTAGGEIPYDGSIGWDLDPQYIQNTVTVTRAGGESRVTDLASQRRYFPLSMSLDTLARVDAQTLALAQHLLNKYKTANLRISALQVDVSANPSALTAVLSLAFGDRVTVKRRTRALTMSQDFFVLSRDHTVGPNSWVTTFTLAPTEPRQAWILGDTTWGALGATTIPVY